MNQCDAPPESPSTKPDASFSPPLSKPTQSANNYQLNQLDSQQNFETNPNASQPTIGDPTDASSIDRQPTGQSNAPEQLYQLLHKRRLYLDAQEPVKEANLRLSLPLANSSLLTSLAQPLDSSSHSAFTSNNPPANHSSSPTDESYKLSGSNSRFTNRIMLYFEKTNKCHRESSQVSLNFFLDERLFEWIFFRAVSLDFAVQIHLQACLREFSVRTVFMICPRSA